MKKQYKLKKSVKYCAIGFLIGSLFTLIICYAVFNRAEADSSESLKTCYIESAPVIENERISLGEFKVTAYCSCTKCCGKWSDGITRTGAPAIENHTIAVDPDVIPYGSIVEINGVEYVAEDTGGSITDKRIDIYFSNHTDALKYGVQYHEVFLIKEV